MSLAFSFAVMSRKFAKPGIPYYVYKAFNSHFCGFQTSWLHWLGMTIGCCTVSIAFTNYLFFMFPANIAFLKPICAIAIVLGLTLINIKNSVFGVGLITLITFFKVGTLLLLVISAIKYFSLSKLFVPSKSNDPYAIYSILKAMPLALFAFLGLESATASGDAVKNPEKTIPISTLLGTFIAALVFIAVHVSVMSVLPIEQQIISQTPVADVANQTMGSIAVVLISFMACFGLIGSINGLIFVSSYILFNASTMGWIPQNVQYLSRKSQFPVLAGLCSATLITCAIVIYYLGIINMQLLVYVDALLLILVYLFGTIAYKIHGGNYFIFLINLMSCIVLIYGCGTIAIMSAISLMLCGSVIFYIRKNSFRSID